MVLSPQCGDFNEDLRNFDINALRAALRIQLAPEDVARFLSTRVSTGTGDEAAYSALTVRRRSSGFSLFGEGRAHGLLERATLRQAVRPRNGGSRLFSVAPSRALYIARQNSRLPPSSASLRPLSLRSAVQVRSARRLSSP